MKHLNIVAVGCFETLLNNRLLLKGIQEYSDSEHEHVRKSISWALREIGKKDFTYNEKGFVNRQNEEGVFATEVMLPLS